MNGTEAVSESKDYHEIGPSDKANQNEMNYIELLEDIPEFVGEDLQHYGPFKKGQIIRISLGWQQNAEIMVDRGIARQYSNPQIIPTVDDPLIVWAKYYHSLGWNVIPIKGKNYLTGKHKGESIEPEKESKMPLLDTWTEYQTRKITSQEIEQWWARWPMANIGILTGTINDLWVLDVDGQEGFESLQELIQQNGELPNTPSVATGKGYHYYFKADGAEIKNRTRFMKGLDTRGNGGYIIAPRSYHLERDRFYLWKRTPEEVSPQIAPEWLLNATNKKYQIDNSSDGKQLKKLIFDKGFIPTGSRNQDLTRLSGLLHGLGFDEDRIENFLLLANETLTGTPLPQEEVRRITKKWEKRKFSNDDLGNAERLISRYGHLFRLCPQLNKFYVWDDKRWLEDDGHIIREMGKDAILGIIQNETSGLIDKDEIDAIYDWARRSRSKNKIDAMIGVLDTFRDIKIRPDQLDQDTDLLCCNNGILDLTTFELRPHRQEDYITKIIDVDYDPEATHQVWDNYIKTALPDEGVRIFTQKVAGLCLTGKLHEQKFFNIYGPPDAGKSRFADALTSILGEDIYLATSDFGTFEKTKTAIKGQARSDIMRMKGKRAVIIHEVPEDGQKINERFLTTWTGGDPITTRELFKKEEGFTPTSTIIFVGNHKIKYSGHEDAMIKRTVFIPFENRIPAALQDKELSMKFKTWPEVRKAILTWMVNGLKLYYEDKNVNKELTLPEKVQELTNIANLENDPVKSFIEKCCYEGLKYNADARTLYEEFKEYCEAEGIGVLSQTKFGKILTKKGYKKDMGKRPILYLGLGIFQKRESNNYFEEDVIIET